jgi:hypothetical protein
VPATVDLPHSALLPQSAELPHNALLPQSALLLVGAHECIGDLHLSAIRDQEQKRGTGKFLVDICGQSTTIWLWIVWVQHLRLCLIQPGGQ